MSRVMFLGVYGVVGNLPRLPCLSVSGRIERSLQTNTLLTKNHESRIDADSRKPGGKAGPPVKLLQMQEGPHHRILERIFRILAILCHAVNGVIDTFGVSCAQFDKGPLLAGSRRLNQQIVPHSVGLKTMGNTATYHAACTHRNN